MQVSGGKQTKVATHAGPAQEPLSTRSSSTTTPPARSSKSTSSPARSSPIGKPGIYASADPSPDGAYLLVDRIKRPYSYSVPMNGFARSIEIWDRDGNPVKTIADLPTAEDVPMNGVPVGPARRSTGRP